MLQSTLQQLRLLYWKWKFINEGFPMDDARTRARYKLLEYPYVTRQEMLPSQKL